jgi:hypothetical protein
MGRLVWQPDQSAAVAMTARILWVMAFSTVEVTLTL